LITTHHLYTREVTQIPLYNLKKKNCTCTFKDQPHVTTMPFCHLCNDMLHLHQNLIMRYVPHNAQSIFGVLK